jgi:hypothetical protein
VRCSEPTPGRTRSSALISTPTAGCALAGRRPGMRSPPRLGRPGSERVRLQLRRNPLDRIPVPSGLGRDQLDGSLCNVADRGNLAFLACCVSTPMTPKCPAVVDDEGDEAPSWVCWSEYGSTAAILAPPGAGCRRSASSPGRPPTAQASPPARICRPVRANCLRLNHERSPMDRIPRPFAVSSTAA